MMNRLMTNRVRAIEAAEDAARRDMCRPIRMQGKGWRADEEALRSYAWRKALGQRGIWHRGMIAGAMATVLLGAAGVGWPFVIGVVVGVMCVGVQSWQYVDEWKDAGEVSNN